MTAVAVSRPRPVLVLVSLAATWLLSVLLLPVVLLTWLVYLVSGLPVGVREFTGLVAFLVLGALFLGLVSL